MADDSGRGDNRRDPDPGRQVQGENTKDKAGRGAADPHDNRVGGPQAPSRNHPYGDDGRGANNTTANNDHAHNSNHTTGNTQNTGNGSQSSTGDSHHGRDAAQGTTTNNNSNQSNHQQTSNYGSNQSTAAQNDRAHNSSNNNGSGGGSSDWRTVGGRTQDGNFVQQDGKGHTRTIASDGMVTTYDNNGNVISVTGDKSANQGYNASREIPDPTYPGTPTGNRTGYNGSRETVDSGYPTTPTSNRGGYNADREIAAPGQTSPAGSHGGSSGVDGSGNDGSSIVHHQPFVDPNPNNSSTYYPTNPGWGAASNAGKPGQTSPHPSMPPDGWQAGLDGINQSDNAVGGKTPEQPQATVVNWQPTEEQQANIDWRVRNAREQRLFSGSGLEAPIDDKDTRNGAPQPEAPLFPDKPPLSYSTVGLPNPSISPVDQPAPSVYSPPPVSSEAGGYSPPASAAVPEPSLPPPSAITDPTPATSAQDRLNAGREQRLMSGLDGLGADPNSGL